MRKDVVGILLAVLLVFSGCQQDTSPSDQTAGTEAGTAIGTTAGTENCTGFTVNVFELLQMKENVPETTVIRSTEELEDFIGDYVLMGNMHDETSSDIKKYRTTAEKYDRSFFQDRFLLIAVFGNSSTIQYEAERIDANGQIFIKQSHYEMVTDDTVYHNMIFVLDNIDYRDDFRLVVRDEIRKA